MGLGRAGSPVSCLTPGICFVPVKFTGNGASDPTGVEGRGVTVVRNGAAGRYLITITDQNSKGGTIDIWGVQATILTDSARDLTVLVRAISETNRTVEIQVQDLVDGAAPAAFDLTSSHQCYVLILVKTSNAV